MNNCKLTFAHRSIVYTHTHNGILFSLVKKKGNPAICDNMDECGGYYANRNELDAERQNTA